MKRQPPKMRRHRERNFDEVIEISFARYVAQATDIMGLERAQGAETVEHHSGLGTKHIPGHLEQAASGGMEEQVNGFRVSYRAVTCERQRIDTIKGEVVAVPD